MSLQQFVAADFVGLDCNGFVGNYLQRVVQGRRWAPRWAEMNNVDPGPTTHCRALLNNKYNNRASLIKDMNELRKEDTYLLAYCQENGTIIDPDTHGMPGHVMITNPGTLEETKEGLKVKVVESTPPKLRHLMYTIKPQAKKGSGVFPVERGTRVKMPVRIARFDVS